MPTPSEILTLGLEHHRSRALADAERCYREVLQTDPNQADAHHLLGVVLFETGRAEEALASLREALRINPPFAEAHYNLARAIADLGRSDEAIASYQRSIQFRPGFTEAHYNLANLLRELDRADAAIACYRQAIACNPAHAKAHTNLGYLLRKRGDVENAVASFEQALKLQPSSPIALANLGHALQERADATRGDVRRAEACYAQVLQLNPTDHSTLNSIGTVYMAQGRFEDAANAFRQALALHPDLLDARNNLGGALHELGLFSEAQSEYQRVLAVRPNFAEAHFNLGISYLLTGDFERGWAEYAWRPRSPLEPKNKPRWDGSSLGRKTILLYPEQGMGDTIQFIRFAAVLKQRGARVLFGCPEPLFRLLETCAGIDELIPDRAPLPAFDCYARLLDLPGLLQVNRNNIPSTVAYLFASRELVETWREKIAHLDGFRVGIAWQGNPKHKGDRQRSVPLQQFEPLAKVDGVELISLQQGFGLEQMQSMRHRFPVYDPGVLRDFMETAALMQNLHLVVTVDSAIAHLAGAMGLAVWVALPTVPDWRWLLNRYDSPWYPNLRLFRQFQPNQWSECFSRITAALPVRKKIE